MFRAHWRAATAVAAAIVGALVLAPAAFAGPSSGAAGLPGQVARAANAPSAALQSLLQVYPGATVYSADTIRLAPGVLLSLPADQPADRPIPAITSATGNAPATGLAEAPPPVPPSHSSTAKPPEPPAPGPGAVIPASGTVYNCQEGYLCLYSEPNFMGYRLSLYQCDFDNLGGARYTFPSGGHWNDKTSSIVDNETGYPISYFYNWDGRSNWVLVDDMTPTSWSPQLGSVNDIIDGVQVC